MESRYSWKEMAEPYNASYYNDIDLSHKRSFIIIDNVTGNEYTFPVYGVKKDQYGYERKVNIINSSLWNQDFFNWICSTAPDFCIHLPKEFINPELIDICIDTSSKIEFIKEVPNLTQQQCNKFVKRLPKAITVIPDKYKTKEMALEVTEIDPELIVYLPSNLATPDLCQKCYEKVSSKTKKRLIESGKMNGLVTKDMVKELVEDSSIFGKFNSYHSSNFWDKIPRELFDFNIADKLITADSHYIAVIPEHLLTAAMCEKAVVDDKNNLSEIPAKFQTFAIQKIAIDQSPRNISAIPEDFLTDEIILYALNKNGLALGGIPKERRTIEFCELAVSNNVKAFRNVPDYNKTYEMCKTAVIHNPNLIKTVPVEKITRQFLRELVAQNIVIPDRFIGYIKECIQVHDKLDGLIQRNQNENISDIQSSQLPLPAEIQNIKLSDIASLFSSATLNAFDNYEITNLEELFEIARTADFVECFGSASIYDELNNTIKLLKCKYLNEDPMININDEQIDSHEVYRLLGLSTRTKQALMRSGFCENSKEFFEKIGHPQILAELNGIKSLGQRGIVEILQKTGIVINYYDSVNKTEEIIDSQRNNVVPVNDNDTLESLKEELVKLSEERKKIDERTDIILAKIKEKKVEQSKGGSLKCKIPKN